MKNKTKIFALVGGLFAGGMFSCCTSAEDRAKAEREHQEAFADSIENARIWAWDDAYNKTRDSIENVNGYSKVNAELLAKRAKCEDERDFYKIRFSKTLGKTMNTAIKKSGTEILQKFVAEMRNLMRVYRIDYDASIFNKDTYNIEEMIFYNPKNKNYYGHKNFEIWQKAIYTKIDESEYGTARKLEIKKNADAIINKMKTELDANRRAVIAQFDKYISTTEPRETLGADCYWGEGRYVYGFDDIRSNGRYTKTEKYVSVYGQDLQVSFFGDETCLYKLVSVGPNKWQVVKTHESGEVEKTQVFFDNVKFKECIEETDEKPNCEVGEGRFSYLPMTNFGVQISYNEVTKICENKNVWTPTYSPAEQRTMDSLRVEFEYKRELEYIRDYLGSVAHSQAKEITNRMFGSRNR